MNKSGEVNVHRDHSKGTHEISGKVYQGIIPSPEMMKAYQEVDPSLPMRLVKTMEDEAAHRRQIERRLIKNQFQTNVFNTLIGLLALVALGVLAYLFMNNGHPTQGSVIAGTIATVISVIVVGKAITNKRKEKPAE
jgi:uncharacterized membrane protein